MENDLPKNWVAIPFTEIFDINGGTQPPKSEFVSEPREGYIRLLQIRDFGDKPVPTYIPDKSKLRKCKSDDVLIARYGASIGRIVTGMDGAYNVALAKVKIPKPINIVFVRKLLESGIFQDPILRIQRTAQNGFNKNDLAEITIPLPPLPEQTRIVAKLDLLFVQLEQMKESLDKIPLLLKDFRQQVLTQAVTGKLTEGWRAHANATKAILKEEKISNYDLHSIPESWINTTIGNIGKVKGGKRLPKGDELVKENTGYPYIRARDLKQGTVLTKNLMYLTSETQKKIKRYKVEENDLYITIVGAKIGDAGIIPLEMNGANLTENAAKITDLAEGIDHNYMALWLQSSICFDNIMLSIKSAAQGKLALTRIKDLPVYIGSLKEQQEIVARVETLFAKADSIELQYQTLKQKIETLPQAILHKAFKGELVPQLESDGDARELLEEIEVLKRKDFKPNAKPKASPEYNVKNEELGRVAEDVDNYKKE